MALAQSLIYHPRSFKDSFSYRATRPIKGLARSPYITCSAAEVKTQHKGLSIVKPYIQLTRLDRPAGKWLLQWPYLWSVALATPPGSLPDIKLLGVFILWNIVMSCTGCTINDIFDQDFDKQVARTKSRPLANGSLTTKQAVAFYGLEVLSLAACSMPFNNNTTCLLGAAQLILSSAYPLMKRLTYWPQAYLGLCANWAVLLGWSEVTRGNLNFSVLLPLFVGGLCWTIVYDTIYAHQDKKDDLKAGVKSTAILFGDDSKLWISNFAIATVAGFALAGYNASVGWPFYLGILGVAAHLAWQVYTGDLSRCEDCKVRFISNKWLGAIMFSGIVASKLL